MITTTQTLSRSTNVTPVQHPAIAENRRAKCAMLAPTTSATIVETTAIAAKVIWIAKAARTVY